MHFLSEDTFVFIPRFLPVLPSSYIFTNPHPGQYLIVILVVGKQKQAADVRDKNPGDARLYLS